MNWGSLENSSISVLDSSKMVRNEYPRGLTIEANKVRTTSLILGGHTGKGEIN